MAKLDIIGDCWREPLPSAYRVKLATDPWERRAAFALRRAVFCVEQQVFVESDEDEIDSRAIPIVSVSYIGGLPDEITGTVRIHEEGTGVWHGSRLAVHPSHRRAGMLGPALIRLAVSTAHARGACAFFAHVQSANVPLFRRLHWRSLHEELLHARPHHFMQADLDHYPPYHNGSEGFLAMKGVTA